MAEETLTNEQILERQREKRRRVHRMKMGIVTFIGVFILVMIFSVIVLFLTVFSLQRQINDLSVTVEALQARSENNKNLFGAEVTGSEFLVTDTKTAEANLAGAEDTLKVYLTFDDGPSSNTNKILDILDDYGVKATFFVVGKTDEVSVNAMKRIVSEGHTIGMHSYTHNYSDLYSSPEAFADDFTKIQNYIYDVTGVDCHFYRFPGGSSNRVSNTDMSEFIKYLNSQGVTYYDWNVASGDATSAAYTTDDIIENVMGDVVKYKTSVVLMHDAADKNQTVEALPRLIEALQAKGALILPVSRDTTVIQHVKLAE